jgi:dTMP kinase
MAGIFITFEGTEGGGKSTQIGLLAARLRGIGHTVRTLREPGGTPIGEEIRHLLKHSEANRAMTPEAELLLMNASRAQLVREVIRPALAAGEIVLCDRLWSRVRLGVGAIHHRSGGRRDKT